MYKAGAIVLMGGVGSRFGTSIPKQFFPLGDKKVYEHTLLALEESALFDEIVIVTHPMWLEKGMIPGGKTRQESSYLGLQGFERKPDIVLIHDAVRPFVSSRILEENITKAIEYGAVDTCIPTADTLVYSPNGDKIESIPQRSSYLRGQTPQTFHFQVIQDAHQAAMDKGITNASDDCQLVLSMGKPVYIVHGSEENIKITTEFDIKIAESLLINNNLTH